MPGLIDALRQQKQRSHQDFYNSYASMMMRGANDVGGFGFDGVKLSYNPGTGGIGEMDAAWNTFQQAAQSRGINASYAQFSQMYNTAKGRELSNFQREWEKMQLKGADDFQIRKLARDDANFNKKITDMSTSPYLDAKSKDIYSSFIPREGLSQFGKDWSRGQIPTGLATPAAAIGGSAYMLSRQGNVAEAAAARDMEFESFQEKQKAVNKLKADNTKALKTSQTKLEEAQKKFDDLGKKKYKKAPKGAKLTASGKIDQRHSYYKAAKKDLGKLNTNVSKLKESAAKIGSRASADDLTKAAKTLRKAEQTRYSRWMSKGGWAKAGLFAGADIGGRIVGGQIGRYAGGTDGAQKFGADVTAAAGSLGIASHSIYKALANPTVKKEVLKQIAEHGLEKGMKKQAVKWTLGRAVLSALGKGAAKQVTGSSLPMFGNLAMAAWTIWDIAEIVKDYRAGEYE